jgi:hypothetical protein
MSGKRSPLPFFIRLEEKPSKKEKKKSDIIFANIDREVIRHNKKSYILYFEGGILKYSKFSVS